MDNSDESDLPVKQAGSVCELIAANQAALLRPLAESAYDLADVYNDANRFNVVRLHAKAQLLGDLLDLRAISDQAG